MSVGAAPRHLAALADRKARAFLPKADPVYPLALNRRVSLGVGLYSEWVG